MFEPITMFSTFYVRGFRAPGTYMQGRGVLNYLGRLVRRFADLLPALKCEGSR
jgi:hypothetical protein